MMFADVKALCLLFFLRLLVVADAGKFYCSILAVLGSAVRIRYAPLKDLQMQVLFRFHKYFLQDQGVKGFMFVNDVKVLTTFLTTT